MGEPFGRNLPLSLPRRLIGDMMHFAQQVPSVPVQRRMNIAPLVAARREAVPRPSWCALFTKAYALVAAARPELRRAYLSFPWPHLYEHPSSVASIAIERRIGDEDAVLFAQIRGVEEHTPEQLDRFLKECKETPIERVGMFRRALRVSRLPRILRRFLWWLGLNWSGYKRARNWGTFGVSVYSGLGAEGLHPLSPLTTTLNYGVISEDGTVDVRIIYDHRVLDGSNVARALAELEQVLNEDIARSLLPAARNGTPAKIEVGANQ
ncbi:MAG TPA: hypothetical protein VEL76_12175 [Gemmataceae bacterium]|nr:hypothetical protein [Gemmataceae bacterium]